MREYSVPATVRIDATENISDAVFDNAVRASSSIALRRKTPAGWVDVTAREFADQVTAVTAGLIAAGLARGDRVALLSATRYEWTLLDFAIAAAGAVTVPIYESSSAEQVSWILANSGAKAVVVESNTHRATVESVLTGLDGVQHIWQIDAGGVAEIAALGAGPDAAAAAAAVAARRRTLSCDDLATLVYTSGTTGRPKGCEVTHRNLLAEAKLASQILPTLMSDKGSVLLFLPLAHVFGKVIQVASVHTRTTIGHVPGVGSLSTDLAEFRPTFLLAVPRFFEKVYNGAAQRAAAAGRGRLFGLAEATAVAWSEAQDTGGPSLALRLRHAVFDRLVYSKLAAAFGGNCRAAVSGGAPLGERLGHFFRGVGLPVYEGYGMTEASGGITINTPDAVRIGTVGRPVPGHAVRIADDGEVLLRGDIVFRAYWNEPAATADVFADGWLRSGDLGELDDAGFLRITGRKKEIIVTAGGKNVAPAILEDRLRAHPLISQCMVVGDQRPFIGALITIDAEALPAWRERNGKPTTNGVADLLDDPDLRQEIADAVDAVNEAVSRAEQVRKFRILPVDFTEEGGELTPTMKVKRAVVEKVHANDILAIYS